MALDPESKDSLSKYTMLAKKVIYKPERMKIFMNLLGSPQGAISAVQSVLAVLNKGRPIPPSVVPLLAVNCYLVMVDIAQAATKVKPDPGVMKSVIASIMDKVKTVDASQAAPEQPPAQMPPQPAAQQPQRGIIASRQGVPA